MAEIVLRFVLGGLIVSLFAVMGEVFKPKTFAGLFGAAPSVAIATLALAYLNESGEYVRVESRSMLIGCAAFCIYCIACVGLARYGRTPVWLGASLAWAAWAATAIAVWLVVDVVESRL